MILQRPQATASLVEKRDVDWQDAVTGAEPADCVPVASTDPLYILYTSGTTGQPKGVVRDNGGHAVALKWTMNNFYNVKPGEVFWGASDIGWQVGHSYIVYGPLMHGATTILFEGKPVGTPMPVSSGASSSSTRFRFSSRRPRRYARSDVKTPTASCRWIMTSPASAPCSSPASVRTLTPCAGPRSIWGYRS